MRVVTRLLADEIADSEHRTARRGVRREQLGGPGVVAGAVDDHVARLGDHPRVLRSGVIVVRVGVRVGDDARHADVFASDLGGDAAPKVLGGYHLHTARERAGWRLTEPTSGE